MPSLRMKEKDSVKCKEWERRRREKLNDAFKNLSQLLPNYDPAKNIAKIDVLEKSTEFVKELRLSNSRLLSQQAETDEKCKLIKELQDEVNKLILRVKQLTTLLKQAKIAIPIGPHIKSLGRKKLKWSEKIVTGGSGGGPGENVENSESSRSLLTKTAGTETNVVTTDKSTPRDTSTVTVNLTGDPDASKVSDTTSNASQQQGPLKEPNVELQHSEKSSTVPVSSESGTSSSINVPVSSTSNNTASSLATTSTTSTAKVSVKPNGTGINPGNRGSPAKQKSTAAPAATMQQTIPPMSLPMQTIILTSCPVAPIVNQNPQMVTRIALAPTRILPKPADGMLRKIAILPIRKPLPPKEKKRRNRKKKVPVVTAEAQVQTTKSSSNDTETPSTSNKVSVANQAVTGGDKGTSKASKIGLVSEPAPAKDSSDVTANSSEDRESTNKINQVAGIANAAAQEAKEISISANSDNVEIPAIEDQQITSMEVDTPEIAEEVEISSSTEVNKIPSANQTNDQGAQNTETAEEDIMEGDLVTRVSEGDQGSMKSPDSISANKTLLDISSSTTQVAMSNSSLTETNKTSKNQNVISSKEKTRETDNSHASSKSYELRVIEASEVERNIQSSELERLNTPNPDANMSMTVTGDKISECIARSIDLIDAPDGELMELTDNWGDSTINSPKSPISPTQMFLNMFPLLPRESIVSVSEGTQQGSSGKSSFPYRSSFYIDSMLPDDPPPIPASLNSSAPEISNATPKSTISNLPILPSVSGTSSSTNSNKAALPLPLVQSSLSGSNTSRPTITTMVSTNNQTHPSNSMKTTALPAVTSTSSSKSTGQKSTANENPVPSSKSKSSRSETKDSNKTAQSSALATSSSTSFLSDFNLFPEPLDFGNFHHLSLSQISLTEDLFREVTRMRNPPDCQQSNTTCIGNSTAATNNTFQQFDFGNPFNYPHQTPQQPHQSQKQHNPSVQASSETNNPFSVSESSSAAVGAEGNSRSHSKLPSTNLDTNQAQLSNQFYQPLNYTPAPTIPDFSHQTSNSNFHTPRYDFNSADSSYNIRQNSYNVFSQESNISQQQSTSHKHNSSSSSITSNSNSKHQLFRPQDFNQTSITGTGSHPNAHRSNISHIQTSQSQVPQPSPVTKSSQSNTISSNKQGSSSRADSQNHSSNSTGIPQMQDSSRKQQNVGSSQNLSNVCQPVNHLPYATSHPVTPTTGIQSNKESSKQQYRSTGNASGEKQSRAAASSKDQQQSSKSYTKSQASKNSESSSSSRKSSSTTCQPSRRANQPAATTTNQQNQPCISQNIPPPRLPDPNQFPLINNAPLPIPSFPDFSLTPNFHQQYETFHAPSHYQHHQHHSSNTPAAVALHPQPNTNHPQQQQRKNTSASARHTPFYLQDVNPPCEAYSYSNTNANLNLNSNNNANIANPIQSINLNPVHSSSHHHHGIHGTTYNSNNSAAASSSQSKSNNYPSNNQSTASSTSHHSQLQPNYFVNPVAQNTPMYPSGYSHQISPISSSSSARTHHQHEPVPVNYNLNANSTSRNNIQPSNSSTQQSKTISSNKSAATTSQLQSSSNQTSYPSSGEIASSISSRPVNWMTTDTSSRTNKHTNANANSQNQNRNSVQQQQQQQQSSSTPANPFSVSKLVGNVGSSGQPATNAANSSNNASSSSTSKPNTNVSSMVSSNSSRCTNNASSSNSQNTSSTQNSSYCAESLIRKNPSSISSSNNNQSWNNLNFSQIQHQNHHHSISHQQHNVSNVPPYEIPHNDQFNFSGYQTTNFPQHNAHQYSNNNSNNPSHIATSESGGSSASNNNPSSNNASNNPTSVQGNIYGGSPFTSHQDQQQQQHSQQQQHHVHQSQYHHHFASHNPNSSNHHNHLHQHHGTTSSVSNFNLSSIFPEINDKRAGGGAGNNGTNNNNAPAGGGSNTGNNTSSSQNNSNSNSCNYYATVHSRK